MGKRLDTSWPAAVGALARARIALSAGVSARHSAAPLARLGTYMLPATRWSLNAETLPTTGRTAVAYFLQAKATSAVHSYAKEVRPYVCSVLANSIQRVAGSMYVPNTAAGAAECLALTPALSAERAFRVPPSRLPAVSIASNVGPAFPVTRVASESCL